MGLSFDEFRNLAIAEIDRLHRLARSLTRHAAESDDLVQETYVKAIRAWSTFSLQSHGIRPWLMRILHNTHINRALARKREKTLEEPVELDSLPHTPASSEPFNWADFDPQLMNALNRLPESLRSTLTLWAMDDLSYQEIADIQEIPIGTVMSRLHRAKATMQQSLQSLAIDRGILRE